jgi:RNA polymerase sigma factor (sigma-70 family)
MDYLAVKSLGCIPLNEFSDEELVASLREGHDEALTVLFGRYRPLVFRIAMTILRDQGEAEDLTQHVFLEIFRSSAQFQVSRGSMRSWIATIAYSRSLNQRKSLARRHFYRWEDLEPALGTLHVTNASAADRTERSDLINRGFAALNSYQKDVIYRVCCEGWTLREIAELKGESLANVNVLHREHTFSDMFVAYLLKRNIRYEEDLVDQLFNSSEKRLARMLLLLAHFGKDGEPETVIPKLSQETLADMIGTTRPRVSFFMNKFRELGFIAYNSGGLQVHSSLLSVVLHD